MFEHLSEDRISRKINRLVAKAEAGGYDDDPDFLDLIDRLYQKRAAMYAGSTTQSALPRLPSM